jgi:hypothetical protein
VRRVCLRFPPLLPLFAPDPANNLPAKSEVIPIRPTPETSKKTVGPDNPSVRQVRLGIGSEFGFEITLQVFDLLPPSSETDLQEVRHTFGFGYNARRPADKALDFFRLLARNTPVRDPHNRQVEGLGGPVKPFWAHHLIDFYRFSIEESVRLWVLTHSPVSVDQSQLQTGNCHGNHSFHPR